MIRRIDDLGRIVIPKEMRNEIGLKNGDEANIEVQDNNIIISNPNKFDLKAYLEEQIKECNNKLELEPFENEVLAIKVDIYKSIYDKCFK